MFGNRVLRMTELFSVGHGSRMNCRVHRASLPNLSTSLSTQVPLTTQAEKNTLSEE